MELKDCYSVLGVNADAGAEDIKCGFRRLALIHHPDRNPENIEAAEAKFKVINEAYETLSGTQSRLRHGGLNATGWGKPWGGGCRGRGRCGCSQWRQLWDEAEKDPTKER